MVTCGKGIHPILKDIGELVILVDEALQVHEALSMTVLVIVRTGQPPRHTLAPQHLT